MATMATICTNQVNLGDGCHYKRTIIHEIGHAVARHGVEGYFTTSVLNFILGRCHRLSNYLIHLKTCVLSVCTNCLTFATVYLNGEFNSVSLLEKYDF